MCNIAMLSIGKNAIFCMQSSSMSPFEVLQKATLSECTEISNSTRGGFTYTRVSFYSTYTTELLILVSEKFCLFFFSPPHCVNLLFTRLKTKQCKNLDQTRGRWSLNIYSQLMTLPFCGLVRNNKASRLPPASAPVSRPPPRAPEWLRNPTL